MYFAAVMLAATPLAADAQHIESSQSPYRLGVASGATENTLGRINLVAPTDDGFFVNSYCDSVVKHRSDGSVQSAATPFPGCVKAWGLQSGDALIAAADENGQISIYQHGGLAEFSLLTQVPAGTNPTAIVFEDLNNDLLLDLLVRNGGSGDVSIIIQSPALQFTEQPLRPLAGSGRLMVGEITGDSNLDYFFADGTLFVGNGTGVFERQTGSLLTDGGMIVAAGDLNGDDVHDLITSSGDVLINDGSGTLSPVISDLPDILSLESVLADVNGDGALDLISLTSDGLSIFPACADGCQFDTGIEIQLTEAADQLTVFKPGSGPALAVFNIVEAAGYGVTNLSSGESNTVLLGHNTRAVAFGATDLFLSNDTTRDIWRINHRGAGVLSRTPTQKLDADNRPFDLHLREVTGDTEVDLIGVSNYRISGSHGHRITVLDGADSFAANEDAFDTTDGDRITRSSSAAADLNGDGLDDLILDRGNTDDDGIDPDDARVTILLRHPDGWTEHTTFSGGGKALGVAAADFGNDGSTDIATLQDSGDCGSTNETLHSVSIFVGTGDGFFARTTQGDLPTFCGMDQIVAGDISGSGHRDLLIADDERLQVLLGSGDNMFTETPVGIQLLAGIIPGAMEVSDMIAGRFRATGGDSVAVLDSPNSVLYLLEADATGQFSLTQTISVPADSVAVHGGLLDGDTIDDLIVTTTSDLLGIYLTETRFASGFE